MLERKVEDMKPRFDWGDVGFWILMLFFGLFVIYSFFLHPLLGIFVGGAFLFALL